jgi:hypothetical protein
MNIFKGLLFLEGHLVDPRLFDDSFGPQYGNQRASERAFREPFAANEFARTPALQDCSPAGCG